MKRYIKSATGSKPAYIEDMIKEIRTMNVSYKGKDPSYRYRIAEIGWDDDIADNRGANEVLDMLEEEYNWDKFSRFGGYCIIPVRDQDEYNDFKSDYMECKREAIARLRHQKGAK